MRIALALLCLLITAKISFGADQVTIKIGTEGLYPPWNTTNDKGELEGFEIDLAQDLCARMGATCKIVRQRWDGMIRSLTDGKLDVVMAGMAITEQRQKLIDFSTCYAALASEFAVRTDNALATTIISQERVDLSTFSPEARTTINALRQALAGTSVGVQIASPHAGFVERYLSDLVDIRYYETLESLARDLDAGRVDAALSSRAYWKRLEADENGLDLAVIGPAMTGDVFGVGIGAGLRKEDDDLRAMLDEAITAALADGTVASLARQWFGYDLSC